MTYEGRIFIAGGQSISNKEPLKKCYELDLTNKTLLEKEDMIIARSNFGNAL